MLLFNQVRLTEEPPVFLGGWGEDTGVQVSTLLRLRPPCCLCDHKGVLCRDPSSFWAPPPAALSRRGSRLLVCWSGSGDRLCTSGYNPGVAESPSGGHQVRQAGGLTCNRGAEPTGRVPARARLTEGEGTQVTDSFPLGLT